MCSVRMTNQNSSQLLPSNQENESYREAQADLWMDRSDLVFLDLPV